MSRKMSRKPVELRGAKSPSHDEMEAWKGCTVLDPSGATVGRIHAIDFGEPGEPTYLILDEGRFGDGRVAVPARLACGAGGTVSIPQDRELVHSTSRFLGRVDRLNPAIRRRLDHHYIAKSMQRRLVRHPQTGRLVPVERVAEPKPVAGAARRFNYQRWAS